MYKIISKMSTCRLSKVLDSVISETQYAFLSGRQILDGVVILNEVINEAKRKKLSRMVFNVDFEKTFDSINWGNLDE